MTIQSLTLAAILSLVGTPQRPAPIAGSVEYARLDTFAGHIAAAVEAPDAAISFVGEAAKEASAMLLTAQAMHESGFRDDVIKCRRRGALGEISAFQLLSPLAYGVDANGKRNTSAAICVSPTLAASRALAVFKTYETLCKMGGNLSIFQGFARGSCRKAPVRVFRNGELVVIDADAGLTRCKTWEKLSKNAGLVGASCARRVPITFAKD